MPGTEKRGKQWRTKPHYRGAYKRQARGVRHAAYADPTTRCWRCGLTLEEKQRTVPHDRWDAGHVEGGVVGGVLLPEHASCNRSAGQAARGKSRSQRRGGYRW